jgi:Ca2+-binding EF-hand superfamily protein
VFYITLHSVTKVAFRFTDTNTVDFSEFLSCMARRAGLHDTEEDLIEAFSVFDREGIGKISAPELRHAMTTLGEKLNDEQADQLILDADTDGTGQIDITGENVDDFYIKMVFPDLQTSTIFTATCYR